LTIKPNRQKLVGRHIKIRWSLDETVERKVSAPVKNRISVALSLYLLISHGSSYATVVMGLAKNPVY
jgi:hypothetical protein